MHVISSRQLEEIKLQEKQALKVMRRQLQETLPALFRSKDIQFLICTENWITNNSRSTRIRSEYPADLLLYELLVAIYPTRQGLVLRHKEFEEILCAAVIFQKWKISYNETICEQDCHYKEKLMRQLEELAVELESSEYIEDEEESKKIKQNMQFIIERRQYV
ncbi:hypothetical protein ACQRBN_05560 [Bariatricus sp. SGI.154]|uniref:hypothetical protein n=1 Tax=Bariatricus sp. SGI.154 TaxID=3420549 RepID=UPI003D06F1EB